MTHGVCVYGILYNHLALFQVTRQDVLVALHPRDRRSVMCFTEQGDFICDAPVNLTLSKALFVFDEARSTGMRFLKARLLPAPEAVVGEGASRAPDDHIVQDGEPS